MVSQPDFNHSSLALRGASSVVSGRTSSRTHVSSRSKRYNRSHTGGVSYTPQNEFPIFGHSGDVEIIIAAGGKENRYLLHRHTLTRCSGFFEASTSQEWSKATLLPLPEPPSRELARIGEENTSVGSRNEVARPGAESPSPRKRWRYELDMGAEGDDIPMLVQKEADNSDNRRNNTSAISKNSLFGGGNATSNSSPARSKGGGHPHSTTSFFRSVANLSLVPAKAEHEITLSQADADLLRDYDNLFRIFYNYPPVLDGINIADAYVQCKSLLTLADQYDALAVVGPRVDHHLLQFQSRLWKQIAKYPVSYLRLGYLSRSKIIFQEALIHVVGQWPAGERSIRQSFPDVVVDIIEDKVDELEETISRIDGRLFRLNLTNTRGERATPQTSYIDWLAVSLFRQWLADNTSPPPPRPPPPPPPSSSHHHRHGSLSASSRNGHHHHASSRDAGGRGPPGPSNAVTIVTPAGAVASPPPPNLASLGRTYRMLGSVMGVGYLGHDECKRFLKLTPEFYSRDNLRRFEKRVDEIKGAAREIVRPLMGSGLELELERGTGGPAPGAEGGNGGAQVVIPASGMTSYLTCVRVFERDLPWDVGD